MPITMHIVNARILKRLQKTYPESLAVVSVVVDLLQFYKNKKVDLEKLFQIMDARISGASMKEICERFNLHPATTQRRVDMFFNEYRCFRNAAREYEYTKKSKLL